jgi:exonuclease VII small subunit
MAMSNHAALMEVGTSLSALMPNPVTPASLSDKFDGTEIHTQYSEAIDHLTMIVKILELRTVRSAETVTSLEAKLVDSIKQTENDLLLLKAEHNELADAEKQVNTIEKSVEQDEKLSNILVYIEAGRATVGFAGHLVGMVPVFGPTIQNAMAGGSDIAGVIAKGITIAQKFKLPALLQWGQRAYAMYKKIDTIIRHEDSDRAKIDMHSVAEKRHLIDFIDIYNHVSWSMGNNEAAPRIIHTVQSIQGLFNEAVTEGIDTLRSLPVAAREELIDTNVIPIHSSIWILYPVNSTIRRVLRMDVGGTAGVLEGLKRLAGFDESFCAFEDYYQDLVGGKWVSRTVNWEGKPIASPSFVKTDQLRLLGDYLCPHTPHFMHEFFVQMCKLESKYTLTHNCHTMSREVVNFCINTKVPHWIRRDAAVKMQTANVDHKYNPVNQPISTPSDTIFKDDSHFQGTQGVTHNETLAQFRTRLESEIQAGKAAYLSDMQEVHDTAASKPNTFALAGGNPKNNPYGRAKS